MSHKGGGGVRQRYITYVTHDKGDFQKIKEQEHFLSLWKVEIDLSDNAISWLVIVCVQMLLDHWHSSSS